MPHRIARDDGGLVRNLSPAVVVSIPVAVGDEVHAGDVVAVVEAMKMESSLTAPFDGRVRQVLVGANVHVAAQAPLLQLEPLDGGPPPASGERVAFASYPPRPTGAEAVPRAAAAPGMARARLRHRRRRGRADRGRPPCRIRRPAGRPCARGRRAPPPADVRRRARGVAPAPRRGRSRDPVAAQPAGAPQRLAGLARRRGRRAARRLHGAAARSARPLRDRRSRPYARAGGSVLPAAPRPGPRGDRARGRRGDPRPSPRAGRAARRAHRRRASARRSTTWWRPPTGATRSWPTWPARCATATSTSPSSPPPARASTPRWRCTSPRSPRTRRARTAMSASRRSWRARGRSLRCSPRACAPPSRPCSACSSRPRRGATTACARSRASSSPGSTTASCSWRGIPSRAGAATSRRRTSTSSDVGAVASAFARHAGTLPGDDLAVLDLYAEHSGVAPTRDELAATLREALAGIPLPPALHRIVVAVAQPTRGRGMSAIDTFTFRHQPEGLVEDEVVRGLHPMMGHRLALWRLENFALERLVSAEDVYAFHGVAHANAKDERLFALAEVRDLTPVRDEDGRIVALPELERILVEVLETIRALPGSPRAQQAAAVEPHPALRVAGRGAHPRGDQRGHAAHGADQPRPRDRARAGGRAPARIRRHGARAGDALLHPRRRGRRRRGRRSVDRAAAAARRERAADRRRAAPRRPAPRRDRPAARARARHRRSSGGHVRRARPRRRRRPGARRPPGRRRTRRASSSARSATSPRATRRGCARDPARRPDASARLARRARVPTDHRRPRHGRGARRAAGVVRALRRGQDRDGQRDREHGLDRRRPAADRAVHPGRRRDQRRRHRHQRRRPAVLERRGDDAHAHARDPRHDARERDGPDRQAGARLLGWRLGRGQLRHRWLRAHHGPERPGPVLGARPRRRLPRPAGPLRAQLRRARRALPAARGDLRPVRARRAHSPSTVRPARTSRASATSSPTRPTPSARSPSTSAP